MDISILEEIDNLIDKYEKDLEVMNYSAVDGSSELERVVGDLKDIKRRWNKMFSDKRINELIKELEKERDNYSDSKKILYVESDIWNIYKSIIQRLKETEVLRDSQTTYNGSARIIILII